MLSNKEKLEIRKALRNNTPYSLTTSTLPNEVELKIVEILDAYLTEIGRDKLKDSLGYCLRELAVNAKKANTKRVYFIDKNLNIDIEHEYAEGMKTFKKDTLEDIQRYLPLLEQHNYYIRISFHMRGNALTISVSNNAAITDKEQIRVFDRIARSRSYNNLQEAMTQAIDETEGAGLGIIILILMLRKIGISEDAFEMKVEHDETTVRLNVPIEETRQGELDTIAREIVNQIEHLPPFSDSVLKLQKLLQDPNVDFHHIAQQIETDPVMIAELLRMANSAQYVTTDRTVSILEAVKQIGIKGMETLIFSYGSMKALKQSSSIKELWDNSYKTAVYARMLAQNKNPSIADDAYVAGILHDIGKILFATDHSALLKQLSNFCRERKLPLPLLEELAAGFNHAEIGALMAEKWNFPPRLVDAIRFQYNPEQANPRNYALVSTVYLANALRELEDGFLPFVFIDHDILRNFGIPTQKEATAYLQTLQQQFKEQQS